MYNNENVNIKGELSVEEVERIDKQLSKFDERLRRTELALERNNVITQQNTAVMEKFGNTLDKVTETMVEISCNTKENTRIIKDLSEQMKEIDDKVEANNSALNGKIAEIEEDNTIKIMPIIKKVILGIILGGGGIAAIIYGISQIIIK